MAEMQMTPGEIRRDYESAKKKKEQLQILADLNCCTVEKIREILIAEGVDKRSLVWTYRQPQRAAKEQQATPAGEQPCQPSPQALGGDSPSAGTHDCKAALTAVRMHIGGLRAEHRQCRERIAAIERELADIQQACAELVDESV